MRTPEAEDARNLLADWETGDLVSVCLLNDLRVSR
jgi:hypothetical protein